MRKRILGVLLGAIVTVGAAGTSLAAGAGELERRIGLAKDVLTQIMSSPDQSIPEELLSKCKAIAVYPHVLKGAFIFGGRLGHGVVLKRDEKTGQWGPLAFSSLGGVNAGLQIGGQSTDVILVVMNERGLKSLLSDNVTLGGDVSVAAGPVGRASSGGTDLSLRASLISYSRSWGLFAGMSLDGAVLTQDNKANTEYYGRPVTSKEILLGGTVEPMPSTRPLIDALNDFSGRWTKNPRSINKDIETMKKYDYEGEITSIDFRSGEMELLDTRPAAERPKTEPASKRIKAEPSMIANLKAGDRVKVMFKGPGNSHEAQRIVRI